MWLEGHLLFSSFFSRTCGFWSCFILEFMIMSREHEKKILNCGHPLLISSHISRTTQWTALDWDPQALSIMMSDDVPPSLQQFEHVQCTITLYHIISHCTWDDIRIIRPFGDVSVGIHSIPFPPWVPSPWRCLSMACAVAHSGLMWPLFAEAGFCAWHFSPRCWLGSCQWHLRSNWLQGGKNMEELRSSETLCASLCWTSP